MPRILVFAAMTAFFAGACGGSSAGEKPRASSVWSALWSFGEERETLPKETPIKIRLEQALGSEWSAQGDRFEATLAAPLAKEGRVLALAGAPVWGEILEVEDGGATRLTMTLRELAVDGQVHVLETSPLVVTPEGPIQEDASLPGGLLGALTKRSAPEGLERRSPRGESNEPVRLGPGAVLRFVLREPLELSVHDAS